MAIPKKPRPSEKSESLTLSECFTMYQGKGWITDDFNETPQEVLHAIEAPLFADEDDSKETEQ